MKLQIKIWKLTLTIDFFDVDPTDRNLALGIKISW